MFVLFLHTSRIEESEMEAVKVSIVNISLKGIFNKIESNYVHLKIDQKLNSTWPGKNNRDETVK